MAAGPTYRHSILWELAEAPFCCILLNGDPGYNVQDDPLFRKIWLSAKLRLCADGGINYILKNPDLLGRLDFLVGDLDSSKEPEAIDKNKVVYLPSQDETDFEKCVQFGLQRSGCSRILAFCHWSCDRPDHLLSSLHVMRKFTTEGRSVVLLCSKSILVVLPVGVHTFQVRDEFLNCLCGLVPISGGCSVATEGFKWNLANDTLEIGSFISSSNRVVSSPLKISVGSGSLLFTISPTHQ